MNTIHFENLMKRGHLKDTGVVGDEWRNWFYRNSVRGMAISLVVYCTDATLYGG
jgi:hypothetical protein